MTYTTLISTTELVDHLAQPDWLIIDCQFSLDNAGYGAEAYARSHIPGAIFADINTELSSPVIPGKTGRHPLPEVETLSRTFSKWGIDANTQVIVYDDRGGMFADRLWWLLRWLGHNAVAVLDGGWPAWAGANLPEQSGLESPRQAAIFTPKLRPELVAPVELVETVHNDPAWRLLDARATERYHGQNETIDPKAGHIPGALSAPATANLGPDGLFLPVPALQERFNRLVEQTPPENIICYCGSGITATYNILALAHAGFGEARLYPGSWSEWIIRPEHPIATA